MDAKQDAEASAATPSGKRNRGGPWLVALIMGGLLVVMWVRSEARHSSPVDGSRVPPLSVGSEDAADPTDDAANPTASLDSPAARAARKQLIGRWILNESIHRDVVFREDGSATMDVKLDFVGSLLYGKEMTLQLNWRTNGEYLEHELLSGTPTENVAKLVLDYGNVRSYRILRLTDSEMLLKGIDEAAKEQLWTRAVEK